MAQEPWQRVFADEHKFQDDVWGQIKLNTLERDVIDTPEFQRLFRTSQLGFVDFVYQTANHSRGAHSIGACHVANDLMNHLAKHTVHDRTDQRYAPINISKAEQVLIRLGALLHDITHVPFSHDVERKTHRVYYNKKDFVKVQSHYGHYDKHDEYASNPLLYLVIFDTNRSILARVLRAYSEPFSKMLFAVDSSLSEYSHLKNVLPLLTSARERHRWDPGKELLPALLFHLLTYETEKEAKDAVRSIVTDYYPEAARKLSPWGLGPAALQQQLHEAWYQPFRHDIIGNTLSADLIDYLKRDIRRLGMEREIDLHLLNYYVLVNPGAPDFHKEEAAGKDGALHAAAQTKPPRYRCAIEVQDHKRGTSRVVLINEIFRLLDLRHEIHEKAVMHRVVQSANAMFSRALMLMGDERKPTPQSLVNLGDRLHALQSEDLFLQSLLTNDNDENGPAVSESCKEADRIISKLVERRVYRPLVIIPGDRAAEYFNFAGNKDGPETETEYRLRTLGAVVDSPYYSRFLLFVSTCIEEYLMGLVDTDGDVLQCAERLLADVEAKAPADCVPSRVIIWTSPYKQLYKDPAVVVALKKSVEPIDELGRRPAGNEPGDAALLKLVKASIDDADAKYAALWKLYVFVSDGLYYTGILNKLRLATTDGQAKHVTRLKNAEALVVAALEVIREDWSKFCRDQAESTERGKCLVGTMAPERLAALVGLWISLYKARETDSREKNPTLGLSEVDVKHYVHEWNTTGCPVEDKCRDIRYKYPISAAGVWAAAKQRAAGMPERKLVEFLEACGITDPAILSTAEFEQLVGQYTGATANRCDAAMREHDGKLNHSHLHLLWQSALRAHQAVAPPVKPVKTKLPRKDAVPVPAFGPKSRIDTEQFLLTLSKRMKGNVGDELQKNTVALAEIIHSYPPAMQSVCIEDIQNLVTKESKFVHNNMKLDEHIPRLRQAWDRIRDGKNEPPADPEEGSGEDSGE